MHATPTHTLLQRSPTARAMRAGIAKVRWMWHSRAPFVIKRSLDVALVLPALLLLAPLFALVALAIWASDRGPVLYWQQRVGRDGRVFRFPKFRSMRTDADRIRQQLLASNQHGEQGVTFKMRHDPRITRVGRVIRRTSIDELPQLWSVLRGDMSLVGPRPPLTSEVAVYTQAERERLAVTPGLTCIWQVSGRSDIPFPQQVQMDIQYIRERSLGTDIALLARTVPAVIKGRGAY
jgi:lipopolysaccharide/colanic/teichoic acid biosynthesis glycosyltransferase